MLERRRVIMARCSISPHKLRLGTPSGCKQQHFYAMPHNHPEATPPFTLHYATCVKLYYDWRQRFSRRPLEGMYRSTFIALRGIRVIGAIPVSRQSVVVTTSGNYDRPQARDRSGSGKDHRDMHPRGPITRHKKLIRLFDVREGWHTTR